MKGPIQQMHAEIVAHKAADTGLGQGTVVCHRLAREGSRLQGSGEERICREGMELVRKDSQALQPQASQAPAPEAALGDQFRHHQDCER